MATMNQSSEAAASGIGGWFDGVSYQVGLSGGSWATGSFVANGGMLPTDLINQVSLSMVCKEARGWEDIEPRESASRRVWESPSWCLVSSATCRSPVGSSVLKAVGAQVWNLQSNVIYPSEDQLSFYSDLVSEVNAKAVTGFPVQIVRQEPTVDNATSIFVAYASGTGP
jgi:hypothetical protein